MAKRVDSGRVKTRIRRPTSGFRIYELSSGARRLYYIPQPDRNRPCLNGS